MAPRDDSPRSPWTRPGFVTSAALLGALIVAGIFIALTSGGNDKKRPTQPPAANRPGKASPAPASGKTGATGGRGAANNRCSLPAGSQAVPSSRPPNDAHWTLVGSMEAPHDPTTYGPQRVNGVWRTCFAHNPTGALYAAISFYATATAAPNAEVDRRLLADGPRKADTIEADRKHPTPIDANGPLHVAGYAYQSYDSQRAVLSIAFRAVNGRLATIPTTLAWQRDDWRVVVPAKGPSVAPLADLSSYVEWGRG